MLMLCQADMDEDRKVGRLKALLAKQANVHVPDKNGWTPLHAACFQKEFKTFALLLQVGADINARDKYGNTPLMVGHQSEFSLYAQFGDEFSFTELIEFYFKAIKLADNLNIKVDLNASHAILKKQFIHYVAALGTPKLLRYIANRVDINSQDANGLTPLHHAILTCNPLMVKELIKLGANVNTPTHSLKMTPAMLLMHILTKCSMNIPEGNPFMNIQWFESPYIMWLVTNETLIEGGFRVRNLLWDQGDGVLNLASLKDAPWLEYAHSLNEKYNYEFKVRLKNVEKMLDLLLKYSDLTQLDSHGNTYLHLAVMYHRRPRCIWKIESLLEKFPQLNTQWSIKNDNHNTSFSLMCRACEHVQVFLPTIKSVFKQQNIDLKEVDGYGYSPLHDIIHNVKLDCFWLELDLPEDLATMTLGQPSQNIVDLLMQDTELTLGALIQLLSTDSSVLTKQDSLGRTFLMRILRDMYEQNCDYWSFLDVILLYKPQLNMQDNYGNTALHIACKYFHLGLVESILGKINNTRYSERFFVTAFKLLEAGSDPLIKNNRGETPLDYVPYLQEYYQSLYLGWIKELQYKDEVPKQQPETTFDDDDFEIFE